MQSPLPLIENPILQATQFTKSKHVKHPLLQGRQFSASRYKPSPHP